MIILPVSESLIVMGIYEKTLKNTYYDTTNNTSNTIITFPITIRILLIMNGVVTK